MSTIQTVFDKPAKVKTGTKTVSYPGYIRDDGSTKEPQTVVKNIYKKTGKRHPIKQIKHAN